VRTRETIGVGMLGYAFMGKAHSRAFREAAVAAVRRSVLQWRFIDGVAARIDDAALREAQSRKDAVAAYELVYAALGA
jgi:hypothetical protein